MVAISDHQINEWDSTSWSSRISELSGSAGIEGALFKHEDNTRLYLMTESSGPSVRFSILKSDIIDAHDLSQKITFFDRSFAGVKVFLKADAAVTRISMHVLSNLVEGSSQAAKDEDVITSVTGTTMKIRNTILANAVMR